MKNTNTPIIVLLVVVAFLLAAIGGLFYLKGLKGQTGTPSVTPPGPVNQAPQALPPAPETTTETTTTVTVPPEGTEITEPEESEEGQLEASYTNADEDLIQVTSPAPGATISSPLTVSGQARGGWYFEATAPVVVVDWDGRIIAEGYVTAVGDWMTDEFVPFEGQIVFTPDTSVSDAGAVILQAANASDLPENDRAVEIPVVFQ
jgi:hypothetical protein